MVKTFSATHNNHAGELMHADVKVTIYLMKLLSSLMSLGLTGASSSAIEVASAGTAELPLQLLVVLERRPPRASHAVNSSLFIASRPCLGAAVGDTALTRLSALRGLRGLRGLYGACSVLALDGVSRKCGSSSLLLEGSCRAGKCVDTALAGGAALRLPTRRRAGASFLGTG
jgi:hypothetical protein